MRSDDVRQVQQPRSQSLLRLAAWWNSTSKAQRLEALKASLRGDTEAPPLETLHLAIIVAETLESAAGEGVGGGQEAHGAAARDAQVARRAQFRARVIRGG